MFDRAARFRRVELLIVILAVIAGVVPGVWSQTAPPPSPHATDMQSFCSARAHQIRTRIVKVLR